MTTAAVVRKYEESAIRIVKHKMFAHRCRRYDVVPSFLREIVNIAECSSCQFLSALIGYCHSAINGIEEGMTMLWKQIVNVLNVEIEDIKANVVRAHCSQM